MHKHLFALALASAASQGHDITDALKARGVDLSAEIAPVAITNPETNVAPVATDEKATATVAVGGVTAVGAGVGAVESKGKRKLESRKARIARLQASFVKDARSYVEATATIVDAKHPQWVDSFARLPKPVLMAIKTPYDEVDLTERCRPFLSSVPAPHIRHCLNYFYSKRNPAYGTQRTFTSKDTKSSMIDFLLVQEKRINTSVLRNIFRYWLLNNENPLYTHFQVV